MALVRREVPVEEHGNADLGADPRAAARAPRSRAGSRSSSRSQTTGQTSSAPMHGCAPSWRRMSICSAQARAPFDERPASEPAGPLRVSTVRLCTGSEWVSRSAAPVANAAADALDPPRVARPRRSWAPRGACGAQTRSSPSRTTVSPSTVSVGLHDDAVEVDRHLDRAADPRRGAERDVDGAENLLVLEQLAGEDRLLVGPDPRARRPGWRPARAPVSCSISSSPSRRSPRPAALLDRRARRGSLGIADRGDRAVDDQPPARRRRGCGEMNPSPHGRLPNAPGSHELARVRDPSPAPRG